MRSEWQGWLCIDREIETYSTVQVWYYLMLFPFRYVSDNDSIDSRITPLGQGFFSKCNQLFQCAFLYERHGVAFWCCALISKFSRITAHV